MEKHLSQLQAGNRNIPAQQQQTTPTRYLPGLWLGQFTIADFEIPFSDVLPLPEREKL